MRLLIHLTVPSCTVLQLGDLEDNEDGVNVVDQDSEDQGGQGHRSGHDQIQGRRQKRQSMSAAKRKCNDVCQLCAFLGQAVFLPVPGGRKLHIIYLSCVYPWIFQLYQDSIGLGKEIGLATRISPLLPSNQLVPCARLASRAAGSFNRRRRWWPSTRLASCAAAACSRVNLRGRGWART